MTRRTVPMTLLGGQTMCSNTSTDRVKTIPISIIERLNESPLAGKNIDKDVYGEDLDKIINTNRFVPDKGFSGTEGGAQQPRSGPVQVRRKILQFVGSIIRKKLENTQSFAIVYMLISQIRYR